MDLPLGYNKSSTADVQGTSKLVCKSHKSIYDPKQASRQWFSKFSNVLISHGYHQLKSDYSLFTKGSCTSLVALLVMLMILSSLALIII